MSTIIISYDPELKRFLLDCSCKCITTICSASKVYFQMMRNSRKRRVKKRMKECLEKGLSEPVNTNFRGTEELLDNLVNDITKALEQK